MTEQFSFSELSDTKKSTLTVDGSKIDTFELPITPASILSVTVGTTGHRGGDSGHGGRTYLKLAGLGSTDLMTRIDNKEEFRGVSSLGLRLGGDSELETFIRALEFATKVLKAQCESKK